MKISLNTIKRFTTVGMKPMELVNKLNRQLGGVEDIEELGKRYEGSVVVLVVSCEDHPDADRLHVCLVDDGGVVKNVDRTADGLIRVVCGAPNVKSGMNAVWLPPGSTVPSTYGSPEPFVLDARKLRGVMSNGMLASAKELAFGDDHDGILEIVPEELRPAIERIVPGTSFAELAGLDDVTIDIENKMFTHRPDCFGQLGVAREIAGIQQQPFKSPDWYLNLPEFYSGEGLSLTVKNEVKDKARRFMVVGMRGVKVGQSPLWLRSELVRLGAKPINNIVDATNYVMLLTAQPTHAYDYSKLQKGHLGVRLAHGGETVTLLNKKTYQLDTSDIVIVDGNGPVGLAGIMGGGDSEVSEVTTDIVLECATFDMYTLRRSSMRHGLFTDALTRFNKGQSPLQNAYIMKYLVDLIREVAGGEVATHVFDDSHELTDHQPLLVDVDFINQRLGLGLSAHECQTILANVEFDVDLSGSTLKITPPHWRTDIEVAEDIVEEVGRLYGFDKLPRELPKRSTRPAPVNQTRELKQIVRNALVKSGANEVLTYSFVHEKVITRANQDPADAFRLSNALSPDLQYYRLSVLPSLLDKVHANIKAGHDEFVLFEIGKGHDKKSVSDEDAGLPSEKTSIDLVFSSKNTHQGAAFYEIRQIIVQLAEDLGLQPLIFAPSTDSETDSPVVAPFDRDRSAIVCAADGSVIGVLGELLPKVLSGFKLPEYTAAASLDLAALEKAISVSARRYVPLSRFPVVTQDISLQVPGDTAYRAVEAVALDTIAIYRAENDAAVSVTPLSIYRAGDAAVKTITLRVKVTHYERTLTDQEVSRLLDAIESAAQTIQAKRV